MNGAKARLPAWLLGAVVGGVGGFACLRLTSASFVTGPLLGAIGGALFVHVTRRRCRGPGEGLIWALASAFLLWLAGPAGLAAWWTSSANVCEFGAVRAHVPELIAYIVCLGTPLGLVVGFLTARDHRIASRGPHSLARALVVGGLAGVLGSWVFDHLGSGALSPFVAEDGHAMLGHLQRVVGALVIGASYGVLFQRAVQGLGSSMGWGLAYGMLWWFLGPMTALPLLRGHALDWSAAAAASHYGLLVGHVFFGLLLGLVHAAVDKVWIALFIESDPLHRERSGVGTHAVLAVGWGALGGFAGGLVFGLAMLDTGILPYVANLVGGTSPWLGFAIHMLLSVLIGMTYGLLFVRVIPDLGNALGWGLLYGLIWWFLGQLTLFPHLLGEPFDWSIEAAGTALPSLVGHLAYGAITAFIFGLLELRHGRQVAVDPRFRAQELHRRHGAASPAPALWVFALGLGVLLPILLG